MLYVKTKIKINKSHKIGLFADQFIKQGTIIWKFTPGFDVKYTREQYKKLPKKAREYLDEYSWLSKKNKVYYFAIDNGQYFNHSNNPNAFSMYYKNEEEVITKAVKDIRKGEEITEDYNAFMDFKKKKGKLPYPKSAHLTKYA